MSLVRQNYPEECEAALNKHINLSLHASYTFLSMAYHFDRDDIALKGFTEYFKKMSCKERELAEKMMKYQNLRGGRIVLADVRAPSLEWNSHVNVLQDTVALEKKLNDSLLDLQKLCEEKVDPQMAHYVTETYITNKVDVISEIGKLLTNAKRCGNDLGLYQFDIHSMA